MANWNLAKKRLVYKTAPNKTEGPRSELQGPSASKGWMASYSAFGFNRP